MTRGTWRAVLVLALLLCALAAPTSASADESFIGPIGPRERCVEPGSRLVLPVVRSTGEDGPRVGQLIRWRYRSATGASSTTTAPVPVDADGFAHPPDLDAVVQGDAFVQVEVLDSERWLGYPGWVSYRHPRARLVRNASFHLDDDPGRAWSHGRSAWGQSPLYEVADAEGACVQAPAADVRIEVWATDHDSGTRALVAQVPVASRTWRADVFLPDIGSYRLSAEQVRGEQRLPLGDVDGVVVTRDRPGLDAWITKASAHTGGYRGGNIYWVRRGSPFTLHASQYQDSWRPVELDPAPRSVQVDFRGYGRKETSTTSFQVSRVGDHRRGSEERTIGFGGRVWVTSLATRTEDARMATFDVRPLPRVVLPARLTTTRQDRPVARTVTVQDGAGLWAELQYRTPEGWDPVGRERKIDAKGKVRLTAVDHRRGSRVYRVAIFMPHAGGGLSGVTASAGTWTIRTR